MINTATSTSSDPFYVDFVCVLKGVFLVRLSSVKGQVKAFTLLISVNGSVRFPAFLSVHTGKGSRSPYDPL